jgi:RsiW-degrading membrane proteinase PrsW (M82 family)
MSGLWVVLLLIFIASAPVFPAYVWLRSKGVSFLWFIASLGTGAVSLGIAGFLQTLLFYAVSGTRQAPAETGAGLLFFTLFIQIALTEETGRFISLALLFGAGNRLKALPEESRLVSFGAAAGLTAGLGFGIIETAAYGAANIGIAVLRAFTAAPLHGACGARVGTGALLGKRTPILSVCRFFSAVALHGMYNFMVINPGIPRFFSILIALLSLIASLQVIKTGYAEKNDLLN